MAYTRKQWEQFNASLPAEDRMSYDFYLTTLSGGERISVQETVPPPTVTPTDAKTLTSKEKQAAVAKLTSGQMLNDAELEFLGLESNVTLTPITTPTPEPTPTPTPTPEPTPTPTPEPTPTPDTPKTYTSAELQAIVAKLNRNQMLTDEEYDALNQAPPKTPTPPSTPTAKTVKSETFIGTGKDRKKVITYSDNTTETIDAPEEVAGSDYEEVSGILTYKGKAYTGAYNGKDYVNGRVVETPGDDIYETLNGIFQRNGKPYTGIYDNKEYKNGIEVEIGSGNYETIGGILTYKGTAYSGLYQGKNYVNGRVVETPGEDKYAEVNGVFTKNNEPFTGEYGGKKYKNGILVQEPGEDKYEEVNGVFTKNGQPYSGTYLGKTYENGIVKEDPSGVDGFTTKDGLLYDKGSLYTGEWQGKNYKDGLLVDDTGEPERPANVNKFFVYNKTTKTWERPAKPQDGATYSWDDNTGWVQETPGADKPAGTPAAYIYDEKTKTWIKPPMPTGGKKYIWDDTKGWTEEVGTAGAGDDAGGDGGDGDNNLPGTGGTYTQADIDKAVAAALAQAKKDADAAAAAAAATDAENTKNSERQSVIKTLKDRFARYGLDSLAKTIEDLAVDGATESTITLALQETDAYKTRFSANDARLKKGLKFLDPAEYLNAEDEYRQKLRDYGLKEFDNDTYVKQFLANDTSLTEISNRIVTAVQRVQNADPAIMKQLKDYYGITQDKLVAYVLDPEQQFEKIKLQVSSAEIGVEAGKQGLSSDVAISEQLAKQGITQGEAQKGYATIADILPTAEKLSAIYGGRLDAYNQSEGEQEVFNSLASAQRKRQKLSAAEIAQFSGSSGLSKTSLMDQTKGTF